MNRKQYLLTLAIVAVISFLGGIVGGAISGGGVRFPLYRFSSQME